MGVPVLMQEGTDMQAFTVEPPRELDRMLPGELSAWLSALPDHEKGQAFRMLPIHRGAVAFLECRGSVRAELLERLDRDTLGRLCRLVSVEVLPDTLPQCSASTGERVEAALRQAPPRLAWPRFLSPEPPRRN